MTHLFATHLRVDSLFFGVLLSYLQCFHEPSLREWVGRIRLFLGLISVSLLSIPFVRPLGNDAFLTTYGFTVIAWGAGGLVLIAYYADMPDRYLVRGLTRVGVNSYSIYLWHMPVLLWVVPLTRAAVGQDISYAWTMLFYVVAAVVVG